MTNRYLLAILFLLSTTTPARALTASSHLGSSTVYVGPTIPNSSWTECPMSGWVADGYGNVYATVQAICAVGEPLPFVLSIGEDVYSPDWKRCMIRTYFKAYALAHGIRCDDALEGTVDAVPYIFWNNAGATNLSTVASMSEVLGAWTGGNMNPVTGVFQYPYSYDGYHPNVGVIPYKGVPYIGMPIEATTRTHGTVLGKLVNTARELQIVFLVGNSFTPETMWITGSLFEVNTPGFLLDVADEGAAVYNSNIDQNHNPCEQRNGTVVYVLPNAPSDFWATNYYVNDLVELSNEYSSQGRYAPNLHPAGTCIPQSATPTMSKNMTPGAKLLTAAQARRLQANYDAMSKFLTEDRLALFRAIPNVQRISDGADGKSVELGYYCAPNERCDPQLIRDEILASRDVESATIADAVSKHSVAAVNVVIERNRNYAGRQ